LQNGSCHALKYSQQAQEWSVPNPVWLELEKSPCRTFRCRGDQGAPAATDRTAVGAMWAEILTGKWPHERLGLTRCSLCTTEPNHMNQSTGDRPYSILQHSSGLHAPDLRSAHVMPMQSCSVMQNGTHAPSCRSHFFHCCSPGRHELGLALHAHTHQ
jgi:hypothetical protein